VSPALGDGHATDKGKGRQGEREADTVHGEAPNGAAGIPPDPAPAPATPPCTFA
jgi:hypothetical protein